jgi:hypothetical protein
MMINGSEINGKVERGQESYNRLKEQRMAARNLSEQILILSSKTTSLFIDHHCHFRISGKYIWG